MHFFAFWGCDVTCENPRTKKTGDGGGLGDVMSFTSKIWIHQIFLMNIPVIAYVAPFEIPPVDFFNWSNWFQLQESTHLVLRLYLSLAWLDKLNLW